jgi:hypothetical protein
MAKSYAFFPRRTPSSAWLESSASTPNLFCRFTPQVVDPTIEETFCPRNIGTSFALQAGVTLSVDLIEELRRWDVEMWSRTNDPMIRWLKNLRNAGLKTAILSNMRPLTW